jgi:DNA polymerase-3 subunit delta'
MQLNDLPWAAQSISDLGNTLPNSLLIYGQSGIGKRAISKLIAQSILCSESPNLGTPCNKCSDCDLFLAETHPDFRLISNEGDEEANEIDTAASTKKTSQKNISIAMIRGLSEYVTIKPLRDRAKVIVIDPADSMNANAANALLKVLEEPPIYAHLILITRSPQVVLPTIASRCLKLKIKAPSESAAIQWLEAHADSKHNRYIKLALRLSSGAPMRAIELCEDEQFFTLREDIFGELDQRALDIFRLAELCEKLEPTQTSAIFNSLFLDVMCVQEGGDVQYNLDHIEIVERWANSKSGKDLVHWVDDWVEFARSANHPLNKRLALEALFLKTPKS